MQSIIEIPEHVATCPLGGPLIFDLSYRMFYDEDGEPVSSLDLAQRGELSDATKYVQDHWPAARQGHDHG